MIRPRKARAIFGSTMAIGLVFVVAGAAFACTKYYGALTGSGNGTGNAATTINGYPDAPFFNWCENPAPFSGTTDAQREASIAASPPTTYAFSGWDTRVDDSGDGALTEPVLTVSVAPSTICLESVTRTNRLPTSPTYNVGISEGYWDETDDGFAATDEDNCHTLENGGSGDPGNGTIIDTGGFAVDSSGNGSKTYTAANSTIENAGILRNAVSGVGGWNTVCVYWPEGVTTIAGTVYWNPANALNFRSL